MSGADTGTNPAWTAERTRHGGGMHAAGAQHYAHGDRLADQVVGVELAQAVGLWVEAPQHAGTGGGGDGIWRCEPARRLRDGGEQISALLWKLTFN